MEGEPVSLSDFVSPEEYQAENEATFPTPQAFVWFKRRHKQRLLDAGALVCICGRHRLHRTRTDQVVLEVGRDAATSRATR